jgi:hypothetical protein
MGIRRLLLLPLSLAIVAAPPALATAAKKYETTSTRSPEKIAAPGGTTWQVSVRGPRTTVERKETSASWSTVVAGNFGLPIVTTRGLRAGPSGDGSTIALASAPKRTGSSWRTGFVVVTEGRVRPVDLTGQWAFDAISPDGRSLFFTESVGANKYFVRPYDVASGRLGTPLVTKTIAVEPYNDAEEAGPMEGLPLDRVVSPDGHIVFTLYDGPQHPFVHGLNVADGWALCFDLPAAMKAHAKDLQLRRGPETGIVEVLRGRAVVAQIADTTAVGGPAVRLVGPARTLRA